jgi:hypothetical protein
MKKLTAIFAVLILATAIKVNAQGAGKVSVHDMSITKSAPTPEPSPMKVEMEHVLISSIKVNDGSNSVPVPGNKGTVKFTKRGGSITNVIYTDAAGRSVRLEPNSGATGGAPSPTCKCPIPDACFGTANKNVGMCICKPCDISNGVETYSIGLLLPANNKIRQASAGSRN